MQLEDKFLINSRKTLKLADPIVEWLLEQPKRSVSYETLLKKAVVTFNGDVITAVSVLGELFFAETWSTRDRTRQAVLASKMVPLVNFETQYSTGHNYHFWRIISASLYKGGTELGRVFGILDNKLESYKLANKAGFDVADAIMLGMRRPRLTAKCH